MQLLTFGKEPPVPLLCPGPAGLAGAGPAAPPNLRAGRARPA